MGAEFRLAETVWLVVRWNAAISTSCSLKTGFIGELFLKLVLTHVLIMDHTFAVSVTDQCNTHVLDWKWK
jgi:hypothetical protein